MLYVIQRTLNDSIVDAQAADILSAQEEMYCKFNDVQFLFTGEITHLGQKSTKERPVGACQRQASNIIAASLKCWLSLRKWLGHRSVPSDTVTKACNVFSLQSVGLCDLRRGGSNLLILPVLVSIVSPLKRSSA